MDDVPLWQIYLSGYLQLVGVVILFYDYIITLGDEYRLIWRGPRSVPQIRFLLNRYFAIISTITTVPGLFSSFSSVASCTRFLLYRQIVMELLVTLSSYNMFLRVYGLYGRDKRMLCLFTILILSILALGLWALHGQHSDVTIQVGCQSSVSPSSALRMAAGWEGALLFDTLVFLFTIVKSNMRPRWWVMDAEDLLTVAFRDGVIYYTVLAFANIGNALTFYLLPPVLKGSLSMTVSCVQATAICRILLNIYKAGGHNTSLTTDGVEGERTTAAGVFTTRFTLRTDHHPVESCDSNGCGRDGDQDIANDRAAEAQSDQTSTERDMV